MTRTLSVWLLVQILGMLLAIGVTVTPISVMTEMHCVAMQVAMQVAALIMFKKARIGVQQKLVGCFAKVAA